MGANHPVQRHIRTMKVGVKAAAALFLSIASLGHAALDDARLVKAFSTIKATTVEEVERGATICTMEEDSNGCSIADMDPGGISTLVDPGGATRCIYSNSGSFKFQVWPGGCALAASNRGVNRQAAKEAPREGR